MGLAWVLCSGGWFSKMLVKTMIRAMRKDEKQKILDYLNELLMVDSKEDDDDGQSSHWSRVSSVSDHEYSCSPGVPSVCQHANVSQRGSNGFQKRVKCKDCHMVLSVQKVSDLKLKNDMDTEKKKMMKYHR